MVAVDPTASLGTRDIDVTIGGTDYTITGRPAADWLELIMSGDLMGIVPGWLDEAAENVLLDQVADGDLRVAELITAANDVISVAAGRPWWWAMQLIMYASSDIHHWSRINGRLVLAGVRAEEISLSAWIDAVYAIYIEGMKTGDDEDGYEKFKMQIDTPPTPELLDEAEEAEAFLSMLG
jgi:hypothetical protein